MTRAAVVKQAAVADRLILTKTDIAAPDIIQGSLEGSNVEPIMEMSRMIELHRSYDSAKSFIEKEDERQKSMIQGLTRDA